MSTSPENSQNIWHKFRSSTKNLSSSFSGLSIKGESDGDTPTSTLVHKALVKFYKTQVPFTGFPGWLGEKEDLPNEQKILRRQSEGKPSNTFGSSWGSVKKASWDRSGVSSRENTTKESPQDISSQEKEKPPTAGMSFQKIYNKESSTTAPSTSPPSLTAPSPQLKSTKPGTQATDPSERVREQLPGAPIRSNTASSSSSMMRDRLKRTNTKTSFNF